MDSLPLLLETARTEHASQQAHFDALDGKAGLLLGFAGAEIALTPALPLGWQVPVLLCLLGAAASAARGFFLGRCLHWTSHGCGTTYALRRSSRC